MPVSTVQAVGDELGIALPDELLARWGIAEGDEIHAYATADGIVLTPLSAEAAAQLQIGLTIIDRHAEVLRKLAN